VRSILVTGSGSGIGAAIARRLAGPEVGLVLHARSNRRGCERVAEAACARGAEAMVALGDLADPATARSLVERGAERFAGLDVVVANAGFPVPKRFRELDRRDLDDAYAVMMGGFLELTRHARPHLERSSAGRVIAVSTLNAHVFRVGFPLYPASASVKAGLETLVRALAVELAPAGVTVNCVAPGLIRKDADLPAFYSGEEYARLLAHVPLGRLGEPEEVAELVGFLAGPAAAYVTGQVIHVNGGIC